MTESSGFFTTTPETYYTEEQFNRYNNALQSNGVISAELTNDGFDAENLLEVVESDVPALSVKVKSGHCLMQGYWAYNSADESLTLASNSSGNPRIDRIVERLDKTANSVSLAVLTGTPGVTPSPPALTRTSTIWEISLAQVEVANGATAILDANITDERGDPAVCGWATAAYRINEDLNAHGHKVVNLADPTAPQDGATKAYVDAEVTGFSVTDLLVDADKDWQGKKIYNGIFSYTSNTATPSDSTLASSLSKSSSSSTTYALLKSITIPAGLDPYKNSKFRIVFDLRGDVDRVGYAKIYRNGAPVGTERSRSGTEYGTFSEDVDGWKQGDTIEIWGYIVIGREVHVRNLYIKGTVGSKTLTLGGPSSW